MSTIIDLTHSLEPTMTVCPGHPPFTCCPLPALLDIGISLHTLSLGSHTGTHIDAPNHFLSHQNALSVDQIPLPTLIGPALVIDVRYKKPRERITWEGDLKRYESKMKEGVVVLLCTGWSKYWRQEIYIDHPWLEEEAAKNIISRGVRVIGVDTLSPDEMPASRLRGASGGCHGQVDGVEEGEQCFDVHHVVLDQGGVIVENLNGLEALLTIEDPVVSLLPLRISGCDGSPVRAVGWSARDLADTTARIVS
ncbi:hypothetical protein JAAARDRAFT_195058 [Jaapia argillacea MUCL 33604]|uniref:Cyclase n=1 Tax=Jaapia argillacea MUCL 33604 TaxID=933084 RepID=A0A067PNN5_9AGAM|nr:hypothetical protein JAAARDRAFT_195058 [Jaapia argillacea MUCL 33604]